MFNTSLHNNAFYILGATLRDDRRRILELAEEKSLQHNCQLSAAARSDLTNPRNRLSAEIAWLPSVAPKKSWELINYLETSPDYIVSQSLPALAKANLMSAAMERFTKEVDAHEWANWIAEFALLVETIQADDVFRHINEDRAIAGFPAVTSVDIVEAALAEQRVRYVKNIKEAINNLTTLKLLEVMTILVVSVTQKGIKHAPLIVDELIDSYEVETHAFLTKETDNVKLLIDAIKDASANGTGAIEPLVKRLEEITRNWLKVAYPIQISVKSRGLNHEASFALAMMIRALAVYLHNERGLTEQTEHITHFLKQQFAMVPQVVATVDDDAQTIKSLKESAEKSRKDNEAWAKQISYRTEVGTIFKTTLEISPEGIVWDKRKLPLESISRVLWGATQHSVNGIPTGTSYTIGFGDDTSIIKVGLRNKYKYEAFIDKLWRAVCVPLMIAFLQGVKAGRQYRFGDVLVDDNGVEVTRHGGFFSSNSRVYLKWSELRIWHDNGCLLCGSGTDSKTYSRMSYLETENLHILEAAIRRIFDSGKSCLSALLD